MSPADSASRAGDMPEASSDWSSGTLAKNMKHLIAVTTLITTMLCGCSQAAESIITVQLKAPPLSESPTEKPFPAYKKSTEYLNSESFKIALLSKLSPPPQTLDVKIKQVKDTTLFEIIIRSSPEQGLDSLTTAVKGTLDVFGKDIGETFLIFKRETKG
jgi:hypothetical protein